MSGRALRVTKQVNYGENVGGRTPAWLRKTSGVTSGAEDAPASAKRAPPAALPMRSLEPAPGGAGEKENAASPGGGAVTSWGYATPGSADVPLPPSHAAGRPVVAKPAVAKKKVKRPGKPVVALATQAGLKAAAAVARTALAKPPPKRASTPSDETDDSEDDSPAPKGAAQHGRSAKRARGEQAVRTPPPLYLNAQAHARPPKLTRHAAQASLAPKAGTTFAWPPASAAARAPAPPPPAAARAPTPPAPRAAPPAPAATPPAPAFSPAPAAVVAAAGRSAGHCVGPASASGEPNGAALSASVAKASATQAMAASLGAAAAAAGAASGPGSWPSEGSGGAGAGGAGLARAFAQLQSAYEKLQAKYSRAKALKLEELSALGEEQKGLLSAHGEAAARLVSHWRQEADKNAAAAADAQHAKAQLAQLQQELLSSRKTALEHQTAVLSAQADALASQRIAAANERALAAAEATIEELRVEAALGQGEGPLTAGAIVQAVGANAFATPAFEQLTGLRWRRPPGAPTGVHEFLHLSSGFRWRFMRRGDVCEDDSEEEEEEEEDQEDGFEMAYKPVSDAQALPEMLRERFTFSKAQMPVLLAKLLAALQRRGD